MGLISWDSARQVHEVIVINLLNVTHEGSWIQSQIITTQGCFRGKRSRVMDIARFLSQVIRAIPIVKTVVI